MPVPGCRIQKNLQASFDRPMLYRVYNHYIFGGLKIKILHKKRDFLRETNGPTWYLENLVGFFKNGENEFTLMNRYDCLNDCIASSITL